MRSVLLIITVAFLYSCSPAVKSDASPASLRGNWEWVRSSGGYAPKVITTASEGYTQRIAFTNSRTYKEWKNDKLVKESSYEVINRQSIYNKQMMPMIKFGEEFGSRNIPLSYAVKGDTLILSEECYDCFKHVYFKLRR